MEQLSIVITKNRAKHTIKELKDKIEVEEYENNNDFLLIKFKEINVTTLLSLFHAGIDCGVELERTPFYNY